MNLENIYILYVNFINTIIPNHIIHLTINNNNTSLSNISQNITHLTFGCQRHSVFFEKKIGYHFNKQIIISKNVTKKAQLFFVG